jgi:hypothetical protein
MIIGIAIAAKPTKNVGNKKFIKRKNKKILGFNV